MADADLIVPVPLPWWRPFRRRYNQAALLAVALGRDTGIAMAPNLLQRRRATFSQGRMSRAGRLRNVRGAFAVRQTQTARLAGRKVVLVEDVMTSGATVEACARALRRAGAARVDVLTLAHVVLAQQ